MRKIIESPAAATHLGTAEGWLRQLKIRRRELKLPMLDKLTFIGPFRILVRASDWGDLIWIRGGDSLDHILLTNNTTSQRYDWSLDALADIPVPASATIADIIPVYDTRCQIQEYSSYTFDSAWTADLIGAVPYEFLGGINRYEMAMFISGTSIYGRIGDVRGNIASANSAFFPEYAGNFGSLFSLPTKKADETPWNLFNGIYIRALNPATQKVLPAWYWTPSLFTVQHQDDALFRGWYYGEYPNRSYVNDVIGAGGNLFPQPLVSLKVSFRGILDTRYTSTLGEYNYGWAELVTEVDGEDKRDIFIYLQKDPLEIPSNTTASFVFVNFSDPWDETIWVGSDLEGFDDSIRLNLDPTSIIEDISVDMWNFQIWTSVAQAQQDTGVCAVVVNGTQATVYRYAGVASAVYTTENYHSHSSSRDGKTIAIFDGTAGIITGVTVLDLFGVQDENEADGYSRGGFTVIREAGDLTSIAATSGCVIPFRASGFEEDTDLSVLPYDLASATPDTTPEEDFTEYLPSMSTMQFNKLGARSPIFHNVVCKNGIDAEFGISIDDCFASVIIQENPNLPIKTEKLVGLWKELGSSQGVVRGDYSGELPNIRFSGIGTPLYTSTLAIMTMDKSAFTHKYEVLGNLGEVMYTGFDEDFEPIIGCDGTARLTASTACSQFVEVNLDDQPIPTLNLTGTETPVVGSAYVATGGVAPYTYSFDMGSIDPDTGEILSISACGAPGDPRWGTVTTTDSCSTTAELEVRLTGGVWGNRLDEKNRSCDPVDPCVFLGPYPAPPFLYFGRYRSGSAVQYTYDCTVIAGIGCGCDWLPSFPINLPAAGLCSHGGFHPNDSLVINAAFRDEWLCP